MQSQMSATVTACSTQACTAWGTPRALVQAMRDKLVNGMVLHITRGAGRQGQSMMSLQQLEERVAREGREIDPNSRHL